MLFRSYQDVDEFVRSCKAAIRIAQKNPSATSMDGIKEIMAQAYSIYNAFLAPGSPCELNIDHQLRNNLATRMTKAVGQDVAMIDTLQEVTALFEDAQNAVFKLMASVSFSSNLFIARCNVPRFHPLATHPGLPKAITSSRSIFLPLLTRFATGLGAEIPS